MKMMLRNLTIVSLVAGLCSSGYGAQSPAVPVASGAAGAGVGGVAGAGVAGAGMGGMAGAGMTGAGTSGNSGAGAGGIPASGAGGMTTTCGTTTSAAGDAAIDDLEDGDNGIKLPRVGYWYTYNDGTCSPAQVPAPDPTGATPFTPASDAGNRGTFGARTSGGACDAGVGFDLNNCNSRSGAHDASAFTGITFWYKSTTSLRLVIETTSIISTARGGTCTAVVCDNGHGTTLAAAPNGATASVSFSALAQESGVASTFQKSMIVNILWQVSTTGVFDFTVDDIAFISTRDPDDGSGGEGGAGGEGTSGAGGEGTSGAGPTGGSATGGSATGGSATGGSAGINSGASGGTAGAEQRESESSDDSGCGCRIAEQGSSRGVWLLALGLSLLARVRRRRV